MKIPSILVVDDEPDNFDVIEALLYDLPYQLHYAASGRSAIASLNVFQPDVILLDVMMPGINGLEVCQRIKAMPKWHSVPIIMVTTLNTKEDLARCLEAGADDFTGKPLNRLELRARVQSMLRIKQQYDQIEALSHRQANTIALLQNNLDTLRHNLGATLPHELNTPLHGISGMIALLLGGHQTMSPEERHELLAITQQSAQKLEDLTARFLQYAQLELLASQPSHLRPDNIDPSQISTQQLIEYAASALYCPIDRANDLDLNLESGEIALSEKHFLTILGELLNNAFKFSTSGTPVKVSSQLKPRTFYLTIADQGRGMTADQITQIGTFMQFERRQYEQQGIGLGLQIVKKIIEIYGGKISFTSVYHQGTTVQIELPIGGKED
jgi:two-component system, sensor histidine kinase and response regulator